MSALLAAVKSGRPVSCGDCGQVYPQDPPFEVECPTCEAPPGSYCRRPSEHSGPFVPFHAARDLLTKERGFYGHDCVDRGSRSPEPDSPLEASPQMGLFDGPGHGPGRRRAGPLPSDEERPRPLPRRVPHLRPEPEAPSPMPTPAPPAADPAAATTPASEYSARLTGVLRPLATASADRLRGRCLCLAAGPAPDDGPLLDALGVFFRAEGCHDAALACRQAQRDPALRPDLRDLRGRLRRFHRYLRDLTGAGDGADGCSALPLVAPAAPLPTRPAPR